MSIGTTDETYPCEYCDGTVPAVATVKGSYCSRDCWLADRGASIRSQIASDHTRCSTCFRPRKDVEDPPRRLLRSKAEVIGEAAIGVEYPTEFLEDGPGFRFCRCGAVDHAAESDTLRGIEPRRVAVALLATLREYYDQGAVDEPPDGDVLGRALVDDALDLDLAIGRAVYGP